jgi:hypothetical protein
MVYRRRIDNKTKIMMKRIDPVLDAIIQTMVKTTIQKTIATIGVIRNKNEFYWIFYREDKMKVPRKNVLSERFKPRRSGIIPYFTDSNGELSFILAVDWKTGNYTDFGGGVREGEYWVDSAVRELKEECYGHIGVKEDDLSDSFVLCSGKTAILLTRIDAPRNIRNLERDVECSALWSCKPETKGIKIISLTELTNQANDNQWSKLYYSLILPLLRCIPPDLKA